MIKLKTIQENFVQELQDARSGKKTRLSFIVRMLSQTGSKEV